MTLEEELQRWVGTRETSACFAGPTITRLGEDWWWCYLWPR